LNITRKIMLAGISIFFILLLIVSLSMGLYIVRRIIRPAALGVWGRVIAWAVLLAALLTTPAVIALRRFHLEGLWVDTAIWTGYLILGFILFVFTLCLIRDAVLLILLAIDRIRARMRPQSRPLLPALAWAGRLARATNVIVIVCALGLCLLGLYEARRVPPVRTVHITLDDLDPALDGFRLVQLSDLHVGPTIRGSWVNKVVERTNGVRPDLVAITGDLVDSSVHRLLPEVRVLQHLEATHGVFFVTGNHEYYSGATPWITVLKEMGLDVLMNEHRIIVHNGAELVVAGVPDLRGGRFDPSHEPDPGRAVADAPDGLVRILLAHQPAMADQVEKYGYDLMIAGHTHGGQFFPGTLLVHLFQPYVAGLYRVGEMLLYVSRGTGYWGPPLRIGAPSEITLLVLHAPQNAG
jgi:hypothetical protein